jgi:uncharacterized membrane protein
LRISRKTTNRLAFAITSFFIEILIRRAWKDSSTLATANRIIGPNIFFISSFAVATVNTLASASGSIVEGERCNTVVAARLILNHSENQSSRGVVIIVQRINAESIETTLKIGNEEGVNCKQVISCECRPTI